MVSIFAGTTTRPDTVFVVPFGKIIAVIVDGSIFAPFNRFNFSIIYDRISKPRIDQSFQVSASNF